MIPLPQTATIKGFENRTHPPSPLPLSRLATDHATCDVVTIAVPPRFFFRKKMPAKPPRVPKGLFVTSSKCSYSRTSQSDATGTPWPGNSSLYSNNENFPFANLKLLASAAPQANPKSSRGKTYKIEEITEDSFKGVDLLSSPPAGSGGGSGWGGGIPQQKNLAQYSSRRRGHRRFFSTTPRLPNMTQGC